MKMNILILFITLYLAEIGNAIPSNVSFTEIIPLLKETRKMMDDSIKVRNFLQISQTFIDYNPKTCIYYAQEAINLSRRIGYDRGEMCGFMTIGNQQFKNNNIDLAIKSYLQGFDIADKISDSKNKSIFSNYLGISFMSQGNYPEAEVYWKKALINTYFRNEKENTISILLNLAEAQRKMKKYSESLLTLKSAFSLCIRWNKDPNDLSRIFLLTAIIHKDNDNSKKAIQFYKFGISNAENGHNTKLLIKAKLELSDLYIKTNNVNSALILLNELNALLRKYDSYNDLASTQMMLAECYLIHLKSKKEFISGIHNNINSKSIIEKSLLYLDSAVKVFKENNLIQNSLKTYNLKGDFYKLKGSFKEASIEYEKALNLKDELFRQELENRIKQISIQNDVNKREVIILYADMKERYFRNTILIILVGIIIFLFVVIRQRNRIKKEIIRSETLLLNILPHEIAEELKLYGKTEARLIEDATVLFTDFKGFSEMTEVLPPKTLVDDLNECFTAFDSIMEEYGLEKIKTIGDSYMAAGGLPVYDEYHAHNVIKAALEIKTFIERGKMEKIKKKLPFFEVRIGVHTGPVVAGIVGIKKFSYDIWGDTVNTASRMESSGDVGQVNISESTYQRVKDSFKCVYRGRITTKGKGEMDMYFVEGPIR